MQEGESLSTGGGKKHRGKGKKHPEQRVLRGKIVAKKRKAISSG